MKAKLSYHLRQILLFIPLALLITSCARSCTESALSDVALDDPGLLMMEVTMEKDITNPNYGGSYSIWIRDKNEQALSLLNGGVELNGKPVSIKKNLANLPYYYANDSYLELKDGESYEINTIIGDGSVYTSSIKLPSENIRWFKAPSRHSSVQSMTVNWNPIHPDYDVTLEWTKSMQADTVKQTVSDVIVIASGKSSYTFPSSFFEEGKYSVTSLDMQLVSRYRGEIHPAFRSDSFWKIIFKADAFVRINDPAL